MRNLGATVVASLDGLQAEDKASFYAAMGTSAEQISGAYDLTGMGRGVKAVTARLLDKIRRMGSGPPRRPPPQAGAAGAGGVGK
jgi:hypothetical protein